MRVNNRNYTQKNYTLVSNVHCLVCINAEQNMITRLGPHKKPNTNNDLHNTN